MPVVSFTKTSDAVVGLSSETLTSDATIGPSQDQFTSDAQVGTATAYTSDALILSFHTVAIQITSDAYIQKPNPTPEVGENISRITNACDIASPCIDPSNPVANFSAEGADLLTFVGYNSAVFIPPLGNDFTSTGCIGQCTSTVSQADADACAITQQVLCQNQDPKTGGNQGGGGNKLPDGNPPQIFLNDEESCMGAFCSDGLPFTYTVAAGQIAAYSKSQANQIALGLACRYARTHIVCMSQITPQFPCVNSSYHGTLSATGNTVDTAAMGNLWQMTGGVFPPGLTFPEGFGGPSINITGTPTQSGEFTFSVRVTTPLGDFMQKTITMCILGVTYDGSANPDDQSLPNPQLNQSYNQKLVTAGCATPPLSWQVTSGSLPDGLSLDEETGVISGTPTQTGDFTFTVTLQTKAS